MAGGKGTRVLSLTNDEIPKPMLPLLDKPILQHQIESLKKNGIRDIIIVIGHRGKKITDYFGNGSQFGVSIQYIYETEPLGTAGALYYLKNIITEDFFLIYGDIIFSINADRMLKFHKQNNASVTLLVHPNSHPFDSDLVIKDSKNRVKAFDSKHNVRNFSYDNLVNSGIYILSPNIFEMFTSAKKTDFEKDVLNLLISQDTIFAYHSPEYVRDVGTPDRIKAAEYAMQKGIIEQKNLNNKQKCIFLDRDGTVNKYKGLIYQPSQIELEDSVSEAIKLINQSAYLCIIVTNQPVVARGMCSIEDIDKIHNKLKTLLGDSGAYVDDIFFCPHHPDKGFPGENPVYKIKCRCRKPSIGLLINAAERYNISLSDSFFIGDTTTDIQTGSNAGCRTVLVNTGEKGNDGKYNVKAEFTYDNLLDAIKSII